MGILAEVLDEELAATFATRMAALCNQEPDAKNKDAFSKKLIYGTDWFMPDAAAARQSYLDAYRRAFLTGPLKDHYDDFFCRNALRFLDLTPQRIRAKPGLTAAQRAALLRLVARAGDV